MSSLTSWLGDGQKLAICLEPGHWAGPGLTCVGPGGSSSSQQLAVRAAMNAAVFWLAHRGLISPHAFSHPQAHLSRPVLGTGDPPVSRATWGSRLTSLWQVPRGRGSGGETLPRGRESGPVGKALRPSHKLSEAMAKPLWPILPRASLVLSMCLTRLSSGNSERWQLVSFPLCR